MSKTRFVCGVKSKLVDYCRSLMCKKLVHPRDLNEQTFASDEDLEEEEKPSLPSPSDGEKATTATSAASSTSAASGFRTHDQGHCRPCVFHSSPGGCRRGSSCNYCHFFHPRVVLVHRIRKSTRDKIKCSWETHWYFRCLTTFHF